MIKENKMWVGVTPMTKDMHFIVPQDYIDSAQEMQRDTALTVENGQVLGRSPAIWFTNLDHNKRHLPMDLYNNYSPEEYPKYDNYDAINVDKTTDIPMDYDGVMGVPITFLDKYCPEQFEIVEFRKGVDGKDLVYSTLSTPPYNTAILQNTHPSMPIAGLMNNPKDTRVNGKSKYARILIRQRQYQE